MPRPKLKSKARSPAEVRRASGLLSKMAALDHLGDTPEAEAGRAALREKAEAMQLRLVSMEITLERLPDPEVDSLPRAQRDRIDAASRGMFEDPASLRAELEALVRLHPRIPMLRNHLAGSLNAAGEQEEADRLIAETYRLFPRYLFAFCNHVGCLLSNGKIEEARTLLETGPRGPLFLPTSFDPTRTVFHISEAVCYASVVGHYLASTDRIEQAKIQLKMCRDVAPDHPQTKALAARLELRSLQGVIARLRSTIQK